MSDLLVARRYGSALLDLASENNDLDSVDADVQLVAETLAGSRELAAMFASPIVPREKKKNVVTKLFGGRVGELTLNFVLLLIDKGREQAVLLIATAYRELRDVQQGVVVATARTAERMTADDEARLRESLEKKTGKHIRLQVSQDPSLLGGVVVRVGDLVYDGSVRNSLANLREQFGLGSARTN